MHCNEVDMDPPLHRHSRNHGVSSAGDHPTMKLYVAFSKIYICKPFRHHSCKNPKVQEGHRVGIFPTIGQRTFDTMGNVANAPSESIHHSVSSYNPCSKTQGPLYIVLQFDQKLKQCGSFGPPLIRLQPHKFCKCADV